MIRLKSKALTGATQKELDALQAKINAEPDFTAKAKKAQALWDSKGGSKGKLAFKEVSKELLALCVFTGICNYCEQSEANDIEHIFPKSFFPAHTFNWENYILACKQCNSGHKLDKGYVLDGDDELIGLVRAKEPPHTTIGFINIRTEDPAKFMMINPLTYKFDLLPELTKAEINKAKATLEILELNARDTLIAARKSAARHYYDMLERLANILESNTIAELEALLSPYDDRFDLTKPLALLKSEIKESNKLYISTYQHPSVWETIKIIDSKFNPRWALLFRRVPEALNW